MTFNCAVFPGQGSQRLGMGQDFVEQFSEAREVFDRAKKVLPFDPFQVCVNDEEKLNLTEFTQPCILTTEIAQYKTLQAYYGFRPHYFAGHSLGEYTALVAAEVIPLEIALNIVHRRGQLMQNAMPPEKSSMAAVIMEKIPLAALHTMTQQYQVDIANDNSEQQVVLSGYLPNVQKTVEVLEKTFTANGLRVVFLKVSGAFHSRYMQEIELPFQEFLSGFKSEFNVDKLTAVASNYTGVFYANNIDHLIDNLTKQLSHCVKWRDNMNLLAQHTQNILEIGPSGPLRNFFQSMGTSIQSVLNVRSVNKIFK